jgi:hypothetical protein
MDKPIRIPARVSGISKNLQKFTKMRIQLTNSPIPIVFLGEFGEAGADGKPDRFGFVGQSRFRSS